MRILPILSLAALGLVVFSQRLVAQGLPACPSDPTSIAYNTCGATPSKINYSRTFSDLKIYSTDSSKTISITAIPALAGAVASIKIAGTEIIATGGHGSSFQFDAHPQFSTPNLVKSECNNPTEAGSYVNDPPTTPGTSPWLGSSSTYIKSYYTGTTSGGVPQITTKTQLAYYIPEGYQSSYDTCNPYWASNGGVVNDTLSNYLLTNILTLGTTVNGTYYSSVLTVNSTFTIPSSGSAKISSSDLQMPMYLQNIFSTEIYYNPVNKYEFIKAPGETTPSNTSYSPELRIFSNPARTYAVGVMVSNADSGPKESKPTTYTETQADTNNITIPKFRIIVPVHNYTGLVAGDALSSRSYFIFGDVALVEGIAVQFCKQWGLCS